MYVIQKTDVVNILKEYNIFNEILELDLERYYTSQDFVCMVIKAICDNNDYIIKIMTDNEIEVLDGNKQLNFAEDLRKKGLPIPCNYKSIYGKYILQYQINDENFLIQVEDYFGKDVEKVDIALVQFLGDFLGKMHRLSIEEKYYVGNGSAYRAIINGEVKFNKICEKKFLNQLDARLVQKVIREHNRYYKEIQNIWTKLPKTAVHADLGLISNIVHNKLGFGVIDFNLAGDECVLGDLLITWYSSRYSMLIAGTMEIEQIKKIRKEFFDAYFKNRKLQEYENINIKKIACFLNGIYYAKYLNQLYKNGYEAEAICFSNYLVENYNKIDFGLDMRV